MSMLFNMAQKSRILEASKVDEDSVYMDMIQMVSH